jgi:hypothetical protein
MPARLRPITPTKNDTQDGILSYYQSEDAGQVYTPPSPEVETTKSAPRAHRRKMSVASSPSEYSPNTDEESDYKFFQISPVSATPSQKPKASSSASVSAGVRRRPSLPSDAGTDRRRLVIVDMSTSDHGHGSSTSTRNDSIRSRRGIETPMHGLALVAPDASPKMYSHPTPPATAPIGVEWARSNHGLTHHRSSSDITTTGTASAGSSAGHRRKSSRQVSIIGTSDGNTTSTVLVIDQPQKKHQSPDALKAPIFQLPQSRASSPGGLSQSDMSDSHGSTSRHRRSMKDDNLPTSSPLVVTPNIGEGKPIHAPVADPVMVSLSPISPPATARPTKRPPSPRKIPARTSSPGAESTSTVASSSGSSYPSPPFLPEETSSYLHYQPGIPAIAGPLPPPPRAVFNIVPGTAPPPRPPRLNSPPPARNRSRGDVGSVRQALQLPDTATGLLSRKTSDGSLSDVRSNSPRSEVSDRSEIMLPRCICSII